VRETFPAGSGLITNEAAGFFVERFHFEKRTLVRGVRRRLGVAGGDAPHALLYRTIMMVRLPIGAKEKGARQGCVC